MSTNYVFAGSDRNLGRFGPVVTGQVLALNDEEAALVVGNSDFFLVPDAGRVVRRVSADATVVSGDNHKQVRCNHSSAMRLTLPASEMPPGRMMSPLSPAKASQSSARILTTRSRLSETSRPAPATSPCRRSE
jgi:hypothetical protein